MNFKKSILWLLAIGITACTEPSPSPKGIYAEGVFVVNEGIFGQTSGSITHFNRNSKAVSQRIFKTVNNRDLGDIVQSLYFYDNKAYIIVNNSNKMEIADAETFEEKAQVLNLRLPRFFLPISNSKAYITEWGTDGLTGTIAVVDLQNNTVTNRISVGIGPEALFYKNNKLYISHIGGYSNNNIISIINTNTDQVENTIPVLDNPAKMVEDIDGNLWVACGGKTVYTTYPNIDSVNSTNCGLVKISTNNNTVISTIPYGKGVQFGNLAINPNNKTDIYYTKNDKVYYFNTLSSTENLIFNGSYYGLGFDPVSQYIFAATSSGINTTYAKRFTTNGVLVDSFQVGAFANGFVFK